MQLRKLHIYTYSSIFCINIDIYTFYILSGYGHAKAEINGICGAEAKGPNASAGASAGVNGAQAFANAELCSASANVGPASVTVGLSAKTGAGITADGIEAKVLGTGFKFGAGGFQLSLFGNSIKFG